MKERDFQNKLCNALRINFPDYDIQTSKSLLELRARAQFGKPSLVCDLMELYRYLVDDFLIGFCQGLKEKDFVVKGERATRKRWGKREYLNSSKTRELEKGLDELFEKFVEVPRIRHGSRQTFETLINEEAQLLAKFLRDERKTWIPRIVQCARKK